MNDQTTREHSIDDYAWMTDEELEASLRIDYEQLAAETEPRIAYDSGDYETEEEAEAALDAFFERIIERVMKAPLYGKP